MARLVAFIALLGLVAVYAKPAPGDLPSVMLGVFENVHDKEQNFLEFVSVHGLPESYFTRENKIGYYKQGDKFAQRFVYWPKVTFDLPFKLNEPATILIGKHNFEYIFTLEEGNNDESPILRTKYRQTDGDVTFNVEQAFSKEGIQITYTRANIVAKRFYRRAIPSYALGAYESDVSTVSDEDVKFYNQHFPLPQGVQWTNKMAFVLGHKGDSYIDRFIAQREYHFVIPFQLNKKQEATIAGHKVTYKYNITESTRERVTVLAKVTTGEETVVYTNTFTNDGRMTTSAKSSKGEYNVTFKKVVPWWMLGKYEDVPDKAENWNEFIKGHEDQPVKYLSFERESQDNYKVTKEFVNGQKVEVPFHLNTPGEVAYQGGKTLKYNFTMDWAEDYAVLRSHNEVSGNKFQIAIVPTNPKTGYSLMIFKRGDVIARRYFRRVLSPLISGKFESNEETEEYKKFAAATGSPNLVSAEYSTNAQGQLVKKGTMQDGKTVEYVIEFGKPHQYTYNEKNFEVSYFASGQDKNPSIGGLYKEVGGPLNFAVVNTFNPESVTVTLVYGGNVTLYGEHVVKRVYTRVGPPVNV